MRALLVQPAFPITYWGFQYGLPLAGRQASLPPLGLTTLAALLPKEWELRLADLNVRPLADADLRWADAVLLSGMHIQEPSMHEVLRRAAALGKRTVVGGPGVTTAPERFAEADVLFLGEAEGRIGELVDAVQAKGRVVLHLTGERPMLEDAPVPRFDLLELGRYASMSVQYSRGCPYTCEFCDIIEIYGRRPRVKSAAQMLAQFERLVALGFRGSVFVVDDNFIGHRPAVKAMLPAIAAWQKARGYPFELYTEASVNLAQDEALVDLMVEAGFTSVFLGIETPSADALFAAGKKQNLRLDLAEAVNLLSRKGLEVMAGFIVGFDEDDEGVFERQRAFIQASPIPLAMVGLLSALPGTQLWRRLEKEERLRTHWTGDQFARPNFVPRLDEEQLVAGYRRLISQLYEPEALYERCERHLAQAATPKGSRKPTGEDVKTLARTLVQVGLRSPARREFRRLLARTLAREPKALSWLVAAAIKAEHMIRYTRESVLPRLDLALEELRRERAREPAPSGRRRERVGLPVVSPSVAG